MRNQMTKYYLLLLVSIITMSGCSEKNKSLIESIEVYKSNIPSGLLSPIAIGDSWIEETEPTFITDLVLKDSIANSLSRLEPSNERFITDVITVRAVIKYENGAKTVIDFNGNLIKVDSEVYKDSKEFKALLYEH